MRLGSWEVACPEWTDFDRPQGVRTVDDGRQIVVIDMGEHDVRRFDVAVQQALLVRIVERTRHAVTMRTT